MSQRRNSPEIRLDGAPSLQEDPSARPSRRIRSRGRVVTFSAALLFATAAVGVRIPSVGSPESPAITPPARAAALTGAPRVRAAYRSWVSEHERRGGDRNVELRLGRTDSRRHGVEPRAGAPGRVHLDLLSGSVRVDVAGLPEGERYRLWLLDNRPGPDASLLPSASDRFLDVGLLEQVGSRWTLERTLGPEALAGFPVDGVLIALEGEHPADAPVMSGSPGLFQRIYSATRTPELWAASDYGADVPAGHGLDLFGPRSAYAARKDPGQPTVVDPDVLIDDLVALGADLFINEDFEGNGRTCETCHDFLNNNTIDPPFIARLPDNDPLFVAEQIPGLASNGTNVGALDVPEILRATALIGISEDGIDRPSVNRAVPHLKGLALTKGPPSAVFRPFSPSDPAPFPLPPADGSAGTPDVTMGFTLDNASVPPFDRGGFGGDLAFEPELGLFGQVRDAVPGAVFLLFTKSLERRIGVDFRLPTDLETDAVNAFYFALGRRTELDLPIPLSDPIAARGQLAFMNDGGATAGNDPGQAEPATLLDAFGNPIGAGKCNVCHFNAGALANPVSFADVERVLAEQLGIPDERRPLIGLTNMNFETGVERLTSQPADLVAADKKARDAGFGRTPHLGGAGAPSPCRGGRGGFGAVARFDFPGANPPIRAGDCIETFSTQPLIEVADTPPFFHNNAVMTIETAVSFYNSDAFNGSTGARILGAITGTNGIRLEASDVQSIAAFLRAINALDNIDFALENVRATQGQAEPVVQQLLDNALAETQDAIDILDGAFVNPAASARLREARDALQAAKSQSLAGRPIAPSVETGVAALVDARTMISPS